MQSSENLTSLLLFSFSNRLANFSPVVQPCNFSGSVVPMQNSHGKKDTVIQSFNGIQLSKKEEWPTSNHKLTAPKLQMWGFGINTQYYLSWSGTQSSEFPFFFFFFCLFPLFLFDRTEWNWEKKSQRGWEQEQHLQTCFPTCGRVGNTPVGRQQGIEPWSLCIVMYALNQMCHGHGLYGVNSVVTARDGVRALVFHERESGPGYWSVCVCVCVCMHARACACVWNCSLRERTHWYMVLWWM